MLAIMWSTWHKSWCLCFAWTHIMPRWKDFEPTLTNDRVITCQHLNIHLHPGNYDVDEPTEPTVRLGEGALCKSSFSETAYWPSDDAKAKWSTESYCSRDWIKGKIHKKDNCWWGRLYFNGVSELPVTTRYQMHLFTERQSTVVWSKSGISLEIRSKWSK